MLIFQNCFDYSVFLVVPLIWPCFPVSLFVQFSFVEIYTFEKPISLARDPGDLSDLSLGMCLLWVGACNSPVKGVFPGFFSGTHNLLLPLVPDCSTTVPLVIKTWWWWPLFSAFPHLTAKACLCFFTISIWVRQDKTDPSGSPLRSQNTG